MIASVPRQINPGGTPPPGPAGAAERRGVLITHVWTAVSGPCPDRELAARRDLEGFDAELDRLLDAHLTPHPQASADGLTLVALPARRERTGGDL